MKNLELYIQSSKPVLVEFYATWSESCNQMESVLQEVRRTAGDRAMIIKVDLEEFSQWVEEYSVHSVPTLIIFQQGKIVWRKNGLASTHEILGHLSPIMGESNKYEIW